MRDCVRVVGSLAVLAALICAGCASNKKGGSGGGQAKAAEPAPTPPPPDSPLAKVKVGMGMKEVTDLIGQPTDMESYATGKQWVPFYYGGDTHRMAAHYKGQGQIIYSRDSAYSGDMRVIEVRYDPNESGYK